MKTLTRKTRQEFVAAHPGYAGMSTREIREDLAAREDENRSAEKWLASQGWRLPTGEAKAKRAEAIARAEAIRELKAINA